MNFETIFGISNGLTANELIKLIGNPNEKSGAEEWESDGMVHDTWKYTKKNIEIGMISHENSDQLVNSILVNSPSNAKTSRNIGIGSSIDEVRSKYAKEIDISQSSENSLVAGSPFGGIIFTFENKKLITIFIRVFLIIND